MKRILFGIAVSATVLLAACSTNSSSSASSSASGASSTEASADSSPASSAGGQTQLTAEQIAKGQALSDSAANLTWFNEVGQAGACGKFSKTFGACEAKAWDLMNAYIDAELELYNGFKSTIAPGECLTQIEAQITDLNAYKTVMSSIHEQAQKMDEKAMKAEAGKLPTPTATNFAVACGVVPPSSSASGSPSPSAS